MSKVLNKWKKKHKNPLQELNVLSSKLPLVVLADINNRISDWFASGGNETDAYIEQQLRFARNYLQVKNGK